MNDPAMTRLVRSGSVPNVRFSCTTRKLTNAISSSSPKLIGLLACANAFRIARMMSRFLRVCWPYKPMACPMMILLANDPIGALKPNNSLLLFGGLSSRAIARSRVFSTFVAREWRLRGRLFPIPLRAGNLQSDSARHRHSIVGQLLLMLFQTR